MIEDYKSNAKDFKIIIHEFNIDAFLIILNKIKDQNPNYNITIHAEKEYGTFFGDCPYCENSWAEIVIRGRRKENNNEK